MHAHCRAVYNSATYVINDLHKCYHVVSQGQAVEQYIKPNAMVWQNQKAVPESQIIVFLPVGRVRFSEAPSNIAVTPFETKQGCDRLSSCYCVFTSFASRTVHQEIAYNFSTDSFLVAFQGFLLASGHTTRAMFS